MSDLVQFSAGFHRAMVPGSNLIDLDAARRERLRAEIAAGRRVLRSTSRAGRSMPAPVRVQPRLGLGRDGPPDAAA